MNSIITILYVDDEPINLMLFEAMFSPKYEVITADSGPIGLDMLLKHPRIGVVISDMRMPEMDGVEFIHKAKALYPKLFYFILTGYQITPAIQKSLDSGLIVQHFQKPFDMSEIDQAITRTLANS